MSIRWRIRFCEIVGKTKPKQGHLPLSFRNAETDEAMKHVKLETVPVSIKVANRIVGLWHRHHRPTRGGLFAIGCREVGSTELCGVAIIGRPVARAFDDGFSAEVTRMCTNGQTNACSFLYGAAWRIAAQMGYKRLLTYTFSSEHGASCRAANMQTDLVTKEGKTWDCASRPRPNDNPTEAKRRWFYGEMKHNAVRWTSPVPEEE